MESEATPVTEMNAFPAFVMNPANAVSGRSQSPGVEGVLFDGVDGSQAAFWQSKRDGNSAEHVHEFDEYFVVVQGRYILVVGGREIPVSAGQECFIPKGLAHAGIFAAGTRTIHVFGGRRAVRAVEDRDPNASKHFDRE